MSITIATIWDTSNPVFVALRKAYFEENPFYIEGKAFVVKYFEVSDPLEEIMKVKAMLDPWPKEVK